MDKKYLIPVIPGFLLMLVSTVCGAQAVLEEVVVTAQKREQSIQDVPISITAISGGSLQANSVQDVYDLRATVPALEVRGVDPPSQGAAFAIRGLGSSVFNMGFEPTVGTFIDGVYISRSGLVASSDLLDLDRVEVLKGPQGTLFGKNTTGGVVHFITNKPSFDELEGSAEVTYQEYDQVRVRGVINVPVQDNFAARIAASWHNGDGYLDNANGEDLNDRDRFTIRGQLLFEPDDNLSIRVIADYSEVDENCCWPVRNTNNPLNPLVNAPLAAAVGSNVIDPPDVDNLRVAANGDLVFDAEDFGISGEINWQLGDITVTSITAYRDYQDLNTKDNDFTGVDILTNTDTLPEVSIVSEEFRIAGVSEDIGIGQSLDWVVGFYYANEKVRRTREFVWGPQITSFPFFAPGLFGNIPGRAFYDEFSQEVDTVAGFGHITIDINDKLSLTGGVRYTNDDKKASHRGQTGNAMAPFNNLPLAVVHDFDAKREDSEATGTASIQYRVTDDVMGFFTYSRGYKSGGISLNRDAAGNALGFGHPVFGCPPGGTPVPASPFCAFPPGDPTFDPEFADHYEIGFKSTLFNNRMRLNASLWKTEFAGLQLQTLRPDGSFQVINVSGATSQGIEADVNIAATDYLDVYFAVQFLDADFDDNAPALSPGLPPMGGEDLPFASDITGNLGANLNLPIGDGGWNFFLNGNLFFRNEYFTFTEPDPTRTQKSHELLSLRGGVNSPDGKWELAVWCRNCTDERYKYSDFAIPFDGAILSPPGTPLGTLWSHYGSPRFVGVTGTFRF